MLLLDFETYYDSEYSLTKMTTPEYLRDPRFRVLGCAVHRTGAPAHYLEPDEIGPYLARYTGEVCVAHNAPFDAAIAYQQYGFSPRRWVCTLMMARYCIAQGVLPPDLRVGLAALGTYYGMEKGNTAAAVAAGGQALRDYALNDLVITLKVLRELAPHVPALERDLIDLHTRMAAEPVLDLDVPLLQALSEGEAIPERLAAICRSRDQFARVLTAKGVTVETKPGKRGDIPAVAKTDAFMQKLQHHPDPVVQRLAEIRLAVASTIKESRAQRLLAVGAPLPVPLKYYGAHTGRASGEEKLNLQNLPSRGPAGKLREAIRAPEGHQLVIVDSAQVEVRVLAWLAGCEDLLGAFRRGADPYREFGAKLYGCRPDEVTDGQRKIAKAAVLALGFGQGANGFLAYCERSGVTLEQGVTEAHSIVQVYRAVHREVPQLWTQCEQGVTRTGKQQLPSGRVLTYPGLRREGRETVYTKHSIFSKSRGGDTVKVWGGLATENLVQAVARDVVMWQTLQLREKYRVVLSVHDEAVMVVPHEQVEEALRDAEEAFARVPSWAQGLPVKGEAKASAVYTK